MSILKLIQHVRMTIAISLGHISRSNTFVSFWLLPLNQDSGFSRQRGKSEDKTEGQKEDEKEEVEMEEAQECWPWLPSQSLRSGYMLFFFFL